MADKKVYTIVINGVSESVDAVDSLLKKLNDLEERINALNQKGIKVEGSGGSSGGSRSRVSDLTAEQKIIDQINRSQEKREVLEGEIGKMLADEKQAMKELNAEQKSLAAMDRVEKSGILNGGDLPTTMLGLKSTLADIKAAMQTMDMNSEQFANATNKALEITNALKSAEEAYGTYSRNVGNYSNSMIEAMKEVTITIGGQEVKFKSLKQAQKELEQSVTSMSEKQEQETQKYKDTAKALQEVEHAIERGKSAVEDLKASSLGMDAALDWMQSFGAMGQITQGFSTFFGNTGFEESIQKLMSVQSVLQGLEQLRKQMNTGEGFGGMFKRWSSSIDEFSAKLFRVKGGMEGLSTATKTTTYAVKGLSFAIKGIMSLGIGLLISEAITLFQNLISSLKGAENSAVKNFDAMKHVSEEFERQNEKLKEQIKLIQEKQSKGEISYQQALMQSIEETNNVLDKQIAKLIRIASLSNKDGVWKKIREGIESGGFKDDEIGKLTEDLNKLGDAADDTAGKTDGFWNAMTSSEKSLKPVEEAQKAYVEFAQEQIGKLLAEADYLTNKTGEYTDAEKSHIQTLINAMNDGGLIDNLFTRLHEVAGDEYNRLKPVIDNIKSLFATLGAKLSLNLPDNIKQFVGGSSSGESKLEQLRIDAIKDAGERQRAQYKYNMQQELKDYKEGTEAYNLVVQKYQNKINDTYKKGGSARVKTAKATAKQTLDVEKEKSRLEIELMSEGLKKRIAQLNKQRDEELKKVKGHKELELRVNQLYDKKILDERKKYAEETKKIYEDLYRNILDMTINNLQGQLDLMDDELDDRLKRMYDRRPITIFSGVSEMFTGSLDSEQMNWVSEFSALLKQSDEFTSKLQNAFNKGLDTTEIQNQLDAVDKRLNDLQKKYDEKGWRKVFGLDSHEIVSYFRNFDSTFQESTDSFVDYMNKTKAFWNNYIDEIKKNIDKEFETRQSLIKKNREKEENDNKTWRKEQIEKLNEHHRNLEQDDKRSAMQRQMDTVQYNLDLQKIIIAAKIKEKQIEEKYNREKNEANREYNAKINEQTKEANAKRLNDDIRSLQSYSQIVSNNLQYQPVKNEFGFMQVAKTNKVLRETLEGLLILRQKIIETRDEATRMWDAGDLSTDEYNNALSDLKNQMDGLEKKIKEVQDGLSWEGKLQDFFQNLQQYYSAVSDAFQNILAAFQESEDYMIERQRDALDKENEVLQKKLEENEKILERHKNNVDKIEGELSDARGDRRERLIDALNAEIIAQRRAQSEEEKLKKEEEKIQRQQEALDKKQRENEYKRGLQQILFNTAASISQASTTGWPMPAPIFMALAAAVGAAQYSLAKQRKPYAEGGILEGPSHSEGGIPVGDTGIEVEGQEFIINKRQTAANRELIEAINNGNGKLTLEDIMNVGGITNVQPLEINAPENTSLETAFVAYAQRPIVVDVREITSRQESVRNVQVLSGIR